MYYTTSGEKKFDFGYDRSGEYSLRVPVKGVMMRRKAKPAPRGGKVCPACGVMRSVAGKCECNS